MQNSFPKKEKLCGQLRIKALYQGGQKFVCWPLRVTYKQTINAPETQLNSEVSPLASGKGVGGEAKVLIWAPKSLFKHAVDRNHLRRLMREAYRLNNAPLQGKDLQIAFNYMDKQIQPFSVIEKAMRKAIRRINDELKK